MYCLAIACPNPHHGGGGRRSFEVLKYLSEFGVTPILYIPYSDLIYSVILGEDYKERKFIDTLRELERFNTIVPSELYETLENISLNIQHHLDQLQNKVICNVLSNIKRSIQGLKNNTLSVKEFFKRFIRNSEINPSKLEFVYSMNEIPSCVVAGAFLAKSLKKGLYVQLQLEPFKPMKKNIINDWNFRVVFGEQKIPREIIRILGLIPQFAFSGSRYSFSYAMHNNLKGLLAVSEAPLVISGLDSWAKKRKIKLKIVRPGNAVDEKISKYVDEKERSRLLYKKENIAIYYARLHSSKGLLEIPFIARKLATKGYRLMMIGRFENIVEKKIFFKICEERKIKNIEYFGWLPRDDLLEIVSRSKVLIYPSHSDAFSLVVLEALFLGCSVVAYDIPAIRSVYENLKPVKIVGEYDCRAMAEKAIEILERDIAEHEEEHLDKEFMNFLGAHSSWRNVAKADVEAIKEMMDC